MNRHLDELRSRAIKCCIVYSFVFAVCYYFSDSLYSKIAEIINTPIIATDITSTFMVPLKLCLFCALLLSLPYILLQIWDFIKPALHRHEKISIWPWIISSCLLFYLGVFFAILIMAPIAINFFTNYAPKSVTVMIDIGNYLDFITTLASACAIAFQVPIITIFALRSGLITHQQLKNLRPYIIVLAFILGMLLTPPDVVSQILLAVPMWALFELGIFIHKLKISC